MLEDRYLAREDNGCVAETPDELFRRVATARQIALVRRAGGGTGIDLSQLRPKGSIVRSSGGTTDGQLSFLKMLSGVTDAIQQGAFRHGANMSVMRVDHPDILAFVDVKSDLAQLSNCNLSGAITDRFMESLKTSPDKPHVVGGANRRHPVCTSCHWERIDESETTRSPSAA